MFFRRTLILGLAACAVIPTLIDPPASTAAEEHKHYGLEEIISIAIEHNPLIARAQGVVRQSRGQQVAAGAYLNPTISGFTGPGAIRDPSTGVRIMERMLTVEQPLEWQGKRRARQQAADAGAAGANAAMDETRLAVTAEVKVAFYRLLFAQQDMALANRNLGMLEEVLRTVNARVAAGEATAFERMKATVETQKAKKEVTRAENALIVARAKLDTVTGGALGRPFSIKGDFESLLQDLDIGRLTTQAREQHPALRRLEKLVEQAEFTSRFERESNIPNVTVHANYRRDAGAEAFVAGLSIPIPLWYQRQGEIESALGAKYRAEADRTRAQDELIQTITQYVQEVRTAHAQLQLFETGLLKQAEETLKIARISFGQGAASLLDLLDAQRVYRQTLLEYAQARADLSIALAKLEAAAGGI